MAALLASVMNSRRLMCASPQLTRVPPYHTVRGEAAFVHHSKFARTTSLIGSISALQPPLLNVGFTLDSGHRANVRGVPRSKMRQPLLDQLIGTKKQRLVNFQTDRVGRFKVDNEIVFRGLLHG